MASAADCPGLYDLVIAVSGGNTTGFIFDDAVESSLPFRTHKATYSYTPTFIERQNVQGDFGDNQQDFFLTATQRDWTEGEQQRYFRQSDGDSQRRYWQGSGVDVRTVGQASMRPATTALTLAANALCVSPLPFGSLSVETIVVGTATNLYKVDDTLTISSPGAHGLLVSPSRWGLCTDLQNTYVSSTSAGSIGVRRLSGPGTFSTFSTTGADSLCYLNNTLYGLTGTALVRYDTAGVATTLFTWKDSGGATIQLGKSSKLFTLGGKLAILRVPAPNLQEGPGGSEIWLYDGTGVSLLVSLPLGFHPWDACVAQGTIFLSGTIPYKSDRAPVVFYWSNGTFGKLWRGDTVFTGTGGPPMTPWAEGLLFGDPALATLLFYNTNTGGVQTVATGWGSSSSLMGATGSTVLCVQSGSTAAIAFQDSGTTRSSATVTTSLFDFDSSLNKFFQGINVEFDSATDGNGGSVDVAYRVGDVDGSYTSLQTGATSGTEYTLSGVSGRSISVKITLNKGTSTSGPVLKRIMVRAAPLLTRFKSREYILNCTGNPGTEDKLSLRDSSAHPLSGRQQVDQLVTASASQSALTITDRLGSFSGIIESLEVYEEHASKEVDPSLSGTFVCKVIARGI